MSPPPEDLPVTHRSTIYPGIEPHQFAGSAKGKVVFITGPSRKIFETTALAFAQSGASVFLVSRKAETVHMVKADTLKEFPETQVGMHTADVVEQETVAAAVDACIERFGRSDIVVSNAGIADRFNHIQCFDPIM